jgi:DNA (cytosine-5)-methyltransferase 1
VAEPALQLVRPGAPDEPERAERCPIESFACTEGRLLRQIRCRDGRVVVTDLGEAPSGAVDLAELADQRWLRLGTSPPTAVGPNVFAADLFCGCGALSAGLAEAARALGLTARLALAADDDRAPLEVYRQSLAPDGSAIRRVDLAAVLDGRLGSRATEAERAFLHDCPKQIDVCLAGPPCQGHSTLNNHTRHDDERNDLYLRVVRFAELRRPRFCLIENVQSVLRDQRRSVEEAVSYLEQLGFAVDHGVVPLEVLGVPQTRRRHVVVACARGEPTIKVDDIVARHRVGEPRTVRWAIGDLSRARSDTLFDRPSAASVENRERMRWLHEHYDTPDLPNRLRPPCHRDPKIQEDGGEREHTYKSMYGRLSWDKPAQTVTSGYGSMGQGRYVHPEHARTLTPHEAARLQLFPDFFRFDAVTTRTAWARMIGNAAPMKLSYAFVLEMLR